MKPLPKTKQSLVLRTDFSDNAAWASLCAAIQEPNEDGFKAFVDCVSDPVYEGLTVDQLVGRRGAFGHLIFGDLALGDASDSDHFGVHRGGHVVQLAFDEFDREAAGRDDGPPRPAASAPASIGS